MTRGGPIATTVVGCAEMRAALEHFARDFDVRLTSVVTRGLWAAPWILRNAARLRRVGVMLLRIPIGGPLPDIADHVEKTEIVRRKSLDRRSARVSIAGEIFARKCALPDVCHVLAARCQLVSPCEFRPVKPAARCELPFSLGRQCLAGPFGVGFDIPIGDVDDGMVVEPADIAARAVGPTQIRAELGCPPFAPVP